MHRPRRAALAASSIAASALALLAVFLPLHSLAQAAASPQEGPGAAGPEVVRRHPLNNDTILRMSKAGLDDNLILQTIRTNPGTYATDPDDLIALKQAGVSQAVIAAMQARSAGLVVRNPTPVRIAPPSGLDGVDEIGVYYRDRDGRWTLLKPERVQFRSGGWLKSTVTNNIVKQDTNGEVDGARSSLILPAGVELLIYTPGGTAPEEYDLLRFREHKDRREFRVKTGNVFHTQTGSDRDEIVFHPERVAHDMYTLKIPADIEKGEYGMLPPGSSNVPGIANAGKIFTFSIRE